MVSLGKCSRGLERIFFCFWVKYYVNIRSSLLTVLFWSSLSSLIFCLIFLLITGRGVLKSQISPCNLWRYSLYSSFCVANKLYCHSLGSFLSNWSLFGFKVFYLLLAFSSLQYNEKWNPFINFFVHIVLPCISLFIFLISFWKFLPLLTLLSLTALSA